MKIRREVLERIIGNKALKKKLIELFKCTRYTIWRYLKDNEEDGPLTKAASLALISKELNIPVSEITIVVVEAPAI